MWHPRSSNISASLQRRRFKSPLSLRASRRGGSSFASLSLRPFNSSRRAGILLTSATSNHPLRFHSRTQEIPQIFQTTSAMASMKDEANTTSNKAEDPAVESTASDNESLAAAPPPKTEPELPPLKPSEFKVYNHLAEKMDYFVSGLFCYLQSLSWTPMQKPELCIIVGPRYRASAADPNIPIFMMRHPESWHDTDSPKTNSTTTSGGHGQRCTPPAQTTSDRPTCP
jgi:hypothetical protein